MLKNTNASMQNHKRDISQVGFPTLKFKYSQRPTSGDGDLTAKILSISAFRDTSHPTFKICSMHLKNTLGCLSKTVTVTSICDTVSQILVKITFAARLTTRIKYEDLPTSHRQYM
jgi:hypothetical protein